MSRIFTEQITKNNAELEFISTNPALFITFIEVFVRVNYPHIEYAGIRVADAPY